MKKRILSLLMAVCLMATLVSVCSVSAFAASTNRIYTQNLKAKAGETIEVSFYASTSDQFACLTFTPDFDYTALELVNVECGITAGSFLYNENSTNPKFIWYNIENVELPQGTPLFTLTFTVKDGAREGTYPITLLFNENDICNENGSRIPLQVEAGELTIFRYLLADVNNDLSIDSADVVMLSRYLVYLETEINTYGADVNQDTNIDGRDLIKLARYMVGLEQIDGIVNY
ncbi:MAG: hypothetical protein IKW03_06300 [Clostridia bacterium]|nr:hypothetical protein [Clostridia bacterium]